jgi:hypothetical protein
MHAFLMPATDLCIIWWMCHRYSESIRLWHSDILQLWAVASKRYSASKRQLAEAIGPVYSLEEDFPREENEVRCLLHCELLPSLIILIITHSQSRA